MNLTLDIGNTYAKLAAFDKTLVLLKTFKIEFIHDNIDDFLKRYSSIKNLIVCSVTDINLNFDKYNFSNIHFIINCISNCFIFTSYVYFKNENF